MNVTSGLILFVMLWFFVAFLIVAFGNRSQAEAGHIVPGTPEGAPANLRIGRLLFWVTTVAAVLWAIIAWIILGDIITRDMVMEFFG